jgi:hypothetical protein
VELDFTTIHKQLVERRILKCQPFSNNNTIHHLIHPPKALAYEENRREEDLGYLKFVAPAVEFFCSTATNATTTVLILKMFFAIIIPKPIHSHTC